MKMNIDKQIEIFRAGQHTDMHGRTIQFTEADLSASASAYDPAKHEAPIVVGHPTTDAPAYGWVKALTASGPSMSASPDQVDAAFAELVNAGRYKKVSASFFLPSSASNPVPGTYYLRHVGFLGAQPPAVKGLKQAEFSDSDEGIVEFGELDEMTVASIFRRIREWLIGEKGKDVADQIIPGYEVDFLQQSATREDCADESTSSGDLPPAFSEENTVTEDQAKKLEIENAELKRRLQEAESAKAAEAVKSRHEANIAFCESLADRLPAVHRPVAVAILDHLQSGESISFSEGESTMPLDSAFKALLGQLPQSVMFGEFASKDRAGTGPESRGTFTPPAGYSVDPDQLRMAEKAMAFAEEKGVDFVTAFKKVS